jgi:hypothetical protein
MFRSYDHHQGLLLCLCNILLNGVHTSLIQPCRKGQKINIWENLYIQMFRQLDRLITEQQVNDPNPLYE